MVRTKTSPILIAVLTAIVLSSVFVGVVNPQWSRWNRIQHQLAIQQKELRHLSAQSFQQRSLVDSPVVRSLSRLWTTSSAAEHSAYLARTMASLCKDSGVQMETLQPMSPRGDETCQFYPATVTFKGDLAGATDLLLRINLLKGVLDVQRLSLRGSGDEGNVTVEMIVSSFSHIPQVEPRRKTSRTRSIEKAGGL